MKTLKTRKYWKTLALPFNLIGSLVVWVIFDLTWAEAWNGELSYEQE